MRYATLQDHFATPNVVYQTDRFLSENISEDDSEEEYTDTVSDIINEEFQSLLADSHNTSSMLMPSQQLNESYIGSN